MQNDAMRDRQFNFRISAEEAVELDRLSEHYQLNAAEVLRLLLRRAAATTLPATREPKWNEEHFSLLNQIVAKGGSMDIGLMFVSLENDDEKFRNAVSDLRTFGMIEKRRGGYQITEKGSGLLAAFDVKRAGESLVPKKKR